MKTGITALVAILLLAACGEEPSAHQPTHDHSAHGEASHTPAPVPTLSSEATAAFDELFAAYEATSLALVADDLHGAHSEVAAIGAIVERLDGAGLQPGEASAAATALAESLDLEAARDTFGDLSRSVVALMKSHPELQAGRHLHSCPMVEDGFDEWAQSSEGRQNPYMGTSMPACGVDETWPSAPPAADDGEIAFWTCPMHTSVRSDRDDICPICSMDLIAVTEAALRSGEVVIDGQLLDIASHAPGAQLVCDNHPLAFARWIPVYGQKSLELDDFAVAHHVSR